MTPRDDEADVADPTSDEWGEGEPPAGGPWYTRLGALACICLGVFGVQQALALGAGSLTEPGPGMWPLILAVAIVVLSCVLLVRGGHYQDTEAFTKGSLLPIAGGFSLLAFWILLPLVGFEIPAVLLVFVWLRFLGQESWRVSVVGSVATVVIFHLIFVGALGVPLPRIV